MDFLFKDILNHNEDPRPQILGALPSIIDWSMGLESFKEDTYHRNSVCQMSETNEVVLACWKKNQITPFHHHPNQSCWIYMLRGELAEIRIQASEDFPVKPGLVDWESFESEYKSHPRWSELQSSKRVSVIKTGDWNYIDDGLGFHSISALTDEVVSLHIYRQLVR